jgi:putative hydrolase of the HAD superfamily
VLAWLRARGLRTGVVTNGAVARQAPKVEALGLAGLLDCVIVSEAVGVQKPDRRIFRLALDALGVEPERAWFVGDNPVNDVLGAAAAGLTAVWFRGGGGWPEAHPEPSRSIDALGELVPLVDRALGGPAHAAGPCPC